MYSDIRGAMRYRSSLFAFLLSMAANAQLRHGPRLGLAMGTITGGQFLQWSGLPKFGPIAGWSFEVPIKRQVFLRLAPMLMSKGAWSRNSTLKTDTYVTHRYIELPMLAPLDLQPGEGGFFLTGGFIYGYWIYGRVRTLTDGQETFDLKLDLSQPEVNHSQWSVAIGLGQQAKRWSWELRGQSSITPFDKLQRSHYTVYGLHLTYRLPLHEKKEKEEKERKNQREELSP